MKGLELAKAYYEEIGLPMLKAQFQNLLPRIAAGLVGEGSECLGYDDEISRDHDFGPAFCLWLTNEDYAAAGLQLQEAYLALPGEFRGVPARNTSLRGDGRVGVMTIQGFYRRFIGNEQPPASLMRWLYLPEDKLAQVTSGQVFADPLGQFSEIRCVLKAYYPEDVRTKKIAARAAVMAKSGQYNYGRCMRRGDVVAAQLALNEFIRAAMSMIYLLNRRYMPYYKWAWRGLENMEILGNLAGEIRSLCRLGTTEKAWENQDAPGFQPYLNLKDDKVLCIENICDAVIRELKKQGLTDRNDDFLENHTWSIMDRIQDPELRKCHVLEG